jgi:shikimate dehydrogenase
MIFNPTMRDHYAVIGNPVSHSKSPLIHAEFARMTGQRMTYSALFAPRDGFLPCVIEFARSGGKGLNVTVPFKEQAFRLATRVSERAADARAVNTLTREGQGWFGDNTDGAGLVRDLTVNLRFQIEGARILLLGAGGAARGLLVPLLRQQPRSLVLVNRTASRAHQLLEELRQSPRLSDLAKLASVSDYESVGGDTVDLIINATSSGLKGESLPLPAIVFEWSYLVYDLTYGPGVTPFLQLARESGAKRIADGIGMLVEQAAESFYIWRGVRPPTQDLIARLKTF